MGAVGELRVNSLLLGPGTSTSDEQPLQLILVRVSLDVSIQSRGITYEMGMPHGCAEYYGVAYSAITVGISPLS